MDTQPEPTLVEFIRYNNWANQQVLAACMTLGESQLAATMAGAYGTIRETFHHILRAEAGYINRMTGARPQPAFKWEEAPSVAELSAYAAQVGEALLDTVQRVRPTDLVYEEEDGKKSCYHARVLFIQIVNHGIEHRTNITTILNSLQQSPPEVDGWGYWWAHQDRFDTKFGLEAGD
jgi:uncharacterized damage-inducible protein DinB